ncbi:MAG: hypothetical protein JOS17DRAFT_469707 [Linnemannia elongata]|nr:MAG: hypothetical protein JOS17DRAFT_469707 [Linnemannia elongata]
MKITSFALCLAAVTLVVVAEAAPGSVGSHFRARMIRDKALLQRREVSACDTATAKAEDQMVALNKSLQNYQGSPSKVQEFQSAIIDASVQKSDASYEKIKTTYSEAMSSLTKTEGWEAVKTEMEQMMRAVDIAAPLCKP